MKEVIYMLKTKDMEAEYILENDKIFCKKKHDDINYFLLNAREFYYYEQNDKYSSKLRYVGDFRTYPVIEYEKEYYYLSKLYKEQGFLKSVFKKMKPKYLVKLENDIM